MLASLLPKFVFSSQSGYGSIFTSGRGVICRHFNTGSNKLSTTNVTFNSNLFRCLQPTVTRNPLVRYFNEHAEAKEFRNKTKVESYRRRDGVPKSYFLIYNTSFPTYLFYSQLAVFVSTCAVITGSLIFLLKDDETEEEKQLRKQEVKQEHADKLKRESEWPMSISMKQYKENRGIKDTPGKPGLEDLAETDPMQMVTFVVILVCLSLSLFRLQRSLPVRIWGNDKNDHCISIMYGHLLPGRLTWHEFLAGTIKPAKPGKLDFYTSFIYQDGSGNKLLLFDNHFRSAVDYNRVMGFDKQKERKE